jgi:hypothetical protein
MPILDSPLFGEEATGSINSGVTYTNQWTWPVARAKRRFVFQRTTPQNAIRLLFGQAVAAWRSLAPADQQPWRNRAPAPLTGYNQFIHCYLTGTTMADLPLVKAYYGSTILGELEYGRDD